MPDIGYPFYAIQNILNLTDEEKIKIRNGMHSNNEIVQILIDDDIDNLMNLLSTNNINLNKNIPESIFECHNILHYSNPLQYAAFLGAIKCFKYILLNSTNIDYELLLQYAIAGGNYEIIHIVENHCENYQFNQEILNLAILYLHNDLIEYIINNYGININWESYMNCIFASNYEALQILNELANYCDRNQYEIKSNYELQKYFISMISIPFTFGYSSIESIPIDVVESLRNGEICDILHFIIINVPFNKDFKIFSIPVLNAIKFHEEQVVKDIQRLNKKWYFYYCEEFESYGYNWNQNYYDYYDHLEEEDENDRENEKVCIGIDCYNKKQKNRLMKNKWHSKKLKKKYRMYKGKCLTEIKKKNLQKKLKKRNQRIFS